MNNRHLIHFPMLIVALVFFTLSLMTTIESFNSAIAQVDQEQIEPIPPSNNTNQTTPIIFSQ